MAAHEAPPSVGFSRQEYWSGLPFPSPDFALELAISEWGKNKGESWLQKVIEGLQKRNIEKRVCTWSGFLRLG